MTRTIAEMAAQRDPLYVAMQPAGEFIEALESDKLMTACLLRGWITAASDAHAWRDTNLLKLTIRALRNQGQPYYDAR